MQIRMNLLTLLFCLRFLSINAMELHEKVWLEEYAHQTIKNAIVNHASINYILNDVPSNVSHMLHDVCEYERLLLLTPSQEIVASKVSELKDNTDSNENLLWIKIKSFECSYCNKKFSHIESLTIHLEYFHKICRSCLKQCSDYQELQNHFATEHKRKKLYEVSCNVCGLVLRAQNNIEKYLKNHIKLTH